MIYECKKLMSGIMSKKQINCKTYLNISHIQCSINIICCQCRSLRVTHAFDGLLQFEVLICFSYLYFCKNESPHRIGQMKKPKATWVQSWIFYAHFWWENMPLFLQFQSYTKYKNSKWWLHSDLNVKYCACWFLYVYQAESSVTT